MDNKISTNSIKVKQIMIFAYDHQGVVMTDTESHVEEVTYHWSVLLYFHATFLLS